MTVQVMASVARGPESPQSHLSRRRWQRDFHQSPSEHTLESGGQGRGGQRDHHRREGPWRRGDDAVRGLHDALGKAGDVSQGRVRFFTCTSAPGNGHGRPLHCLYDTLGKLTDLQNLHK